MCDQRLKHAYFAGVFDGEGSVYIRDAHAQGNTRHIRVEVTLGNCDKRILDAIQSEFGGSVYEVNRKKVEEKDWSRQYTWRASCVVAHNFLIAIQPFVLIKKDYVELAIAFRSALGYHKREDKQQFLLRYREMRENETRTRHYPKLLRQTKFHN